MGFKIEGMDALVRRLKKMENAQEIEKDVSMKGAEVIRKEIEKNTPRSNISKEHAQDNTTVVWNDKEGKAEIGYDKDKGWYLQFLEWGTKYISADPFVERSFHSSKKEAEKAMQDELKRRLGL